jgi:hypothetical protein
VCMVADSHLHSQNVGCKDQRDSAGTQQNDARLCYMEVFACIDHQHRVAQQFVSILDGMDSALIAHVKSATRWQSQYYRLVIAQGKSLLFVTLAHFCLPVQFVASPELHARLKCCPSNYGNSAFLRSCLAIETVKRAM